MVTHFCPQCWIETEDTEESCPACGYELQCFEMLPYEKKLIMALKHPVIQNRMMAIELLGQLKSEGALCEFERMLQQEDEYYQLREVLYALARIDTPRSRTLIVQASRHESMLIRNLAANLVARFS